jgi:hypothetical protein
LPKNYFMKLKITGFLLILTITVYSQNIEADRPDQTETPAIVPKGMIQVESGFSFQKKGSNNYSYTLPSTLWKYGVNENFELRLITEIISEKNYNEKQNGLLPLFIGFKVNLSEEKGIIPKTSLIAHLGLPKMASSNYKTNYLTPEFRFTMQHSLSEKWSLGYNIGAEWDGLTPKPTFVYTLTTGYSIDEKLGSYIELFGFATQNKKTNHNLDGGLTYLITNNFMVDLSSGFGITEVDFEHYFALGISFRL